MDVDGLPIIGPGVDYTEVGAIHQKRTLAFINHFIANTVSFLNKFSRSCEQRLEKHNARLQKIDASLSVLEAKLSSISALENVSINHLSGESDNPVMTSVTNGGQETIQPVEQEEPLSQSKSQDPQYARFFRMIQVGVPIQAVRLKMQSEGLDPSILDEPDAAAAEAQNEIAKSDSSFSD